jgi:peptide chain release factor subunit 3
MVSINAANPVGAVSEFIAQLQILELLDNVSNHAS